jgi:hypothetical protein
LEFCQLLQEGNVSQIKSPAKPGFLVRLDECLLFRLGGNAEGGIDWAPTDKTGHEESDRDDAKNNKSQAADLAGEIECNYDGYNNQP